MLQNNNIGVDSAFQYLAAPIFHIFYSDTNIEEARPSIVKWSTSKSTSSRAAVYDIVLEYQKEQQKKQDHFIVKTPIEVSYAINNIALYNAETAKKAVEMGILTKDIDFAPRVHHIPGTNAVVMRRIEDDEGKPAVTLDSLLEGAKDKYVRKNILDDYFRTLADYQVKVTIAHRKLVEMITRQDRVWLWQGESFPGVEERIIHYFLGAGGVRREDVNPELLKKILECASPIALRQESPWEIKGLHLELPFICHGDGCTNNALYVEKAKKWHIIDPRFRLGHPLSDFAAIASCPGLTSHNGFDSSQRFAVSEWLNEARNYMLLFNEVDAASRGIRKVEKTGIRILGKKESFEISKEAAPYLDGLFLSEFLLYSFRNQAVNNTIEREDESRYKEMIENWSSFKYSREYNEMPKNMKTVGDILSSMPKDYGLSREEGDKVGELVRILEEQKIIYIPGNPR